MKACFKNLFGVNFIHEYFAAGVFTGLQAKPDRETAELLLKNGLLFKPGSSGFSILYDAFYTGNERTLEEVQKNRLTLSFQLVLTDQHFYNYTTDFGADIGVFNFLFTNRPGINCPVEKGNSLHRDKYVSSKELTVKKDADAGLFGNIVITIDSSLQPDYYIRFAQKALYVRYFLVSHFYLSLNQPAIVDGSERYKFSDAAKVTLTNGAGAICFVCDNAIQFKNKQKSNFNLVENYEKETGKYKLVRSGLPLPDVRAVSKALENDNNAGKFFSDIFL